MIFLAAFLITVGEGPGVEPLAAMKQSERPAVVVGAAFTPITREIGAPAVRSPHRDVETAS